MPGARVSPLARQAGGAAGVRRANLSHILRHLRDHGPSSRQEVASGCGLGVSTMTDLVGELRRRGLVRELDRIPRPGAGRPTRPIALDGEPWCVLGVQVDLLAVSFRCSTVGGRELWSDSVPARLLRSGAVAGYALLRDALGPQLDRVPADMTLVAVEVALPGYVATDRGTVGWSESLDWAGMPLRALLVQSLEQAGHPGVAVAIAQDCRLAALHAVREELRLPAAQVAVYLGGLREVGGAVVIDGEVLGGADGGAGDFGHTNVDPGGPECGCGRRGCLESLIGPVTLLRTSGLLGPGSADELVVTDPVAALDLLVAAAADGNPRVLGMLTAAGDALGVALDDVIGALNPHVVILGGFLGVLHAYLLEAVHRRIARRVAVDAFGATTVVGLDVLVPRVLAGADLAARDACLDDPLRLTTVLPGRAGYDPSRIA